MKKTLIFSILIFSGLFLNAQEKGFSEFSGDRANELKKVLAWDNGENVKVKLSNGFNLSVEPWGDFKIKFNIKADDNKIMLSDSSSIDGAFEEYLSGSSSVSAMLDVCEYDIDKDGVNELFVIEAYDGTSFFRLFRLDKKLKKYVEVEYIHGIIPEIELTKKMIIFTVSDEKYEYKSGKLYGVY